MRQIRSYTSTRRRHCPARLVERRRSLGVAPRSRVRILPLSPKCRGLVESLQGDRCGRIPASHTDEGGRRYTGCGSIGWRRATTAARRRAPPGGSWKVDDDGDEALPPQGSGLFAEVVATILSEAVENRRARLTVVQRAFILPE